MMPPEGRGFESLRLRQKTDKFLSKLVGFSYIRLVASYIGCASYICFASDIGLCPVLRANIISLKPQVQYHFLKRKYHSVEDGISLKTICYVRVQIHTIKYQKYFFIVYALKGGRFFTYCLFFYEYIFREIFIHIVFL